MEKARWIGIVKVTKPFGRVFKNQLASSASSLVIFSFAKKA